MAKIKVYAPNGEYTTDKLGSGFAAIGGVEFKDGVGEVDEGNTAVLAYFRRKGYGIGKPARKPDQAESPDPREVSNLRSGTPLRDAAVDPKPGDFLPPTNAGEANPHGPLVVAPQIHAAEQGPKPIVAGAVPADPADQEAKETAAVKQAASGEPVDPTTGVPAGEVLTNTVDAADPDAGGPPPKDLDDGSTDEPAAADLGDEAEPPAKSAKKADWEAYAATQGYDPDEGLTKDEMVDRYGKDG